MSKYIDVDLLKKKIEKRLKNIRDYMTGAGMKYKGPKYYKARGEESAYDALLNIIDSLQQEQQEVDLEKEIKDTCRGYRINDFHEQELGKRDIENIARHFYELGKNSK